MVVANTVWLSGKSKGAVRKGRWLTMTSPLCGLGGSACLWRDLILGKDTEQKERRGMKGRS